MITITGTIKTIIFKDKVQNFIILSSDKNYRLSGQYNDIDANLKDANFKASGDWQNHKKYGKFFKFDSLEIQESPLFYFLSRVVKGIGKKLARNLIDSFGEDKLVKILDETPEKLTNIKGIKEKKLQKIITNWNKFRDIRELSEILIPAGATSAMINRIYSHFNNDDKIEFLINNVKVNGSKD